MDTPIIIPGLGARLSAVIQSLGVSSLEPVFNMKVTGTKVYLDIVWYKVDGPKSCGKGMDATSSTKTPGTQPVGKKKKKSPSKLKRDRRRRLEWRARKKEASLPPEPMVTCVTAESRKPVIEDSTRSLLETSKPEVLDRDRNCRPPALDTALECDTPARDVLESWKPRVKRFKRDCSPHSRSSGSEESDLDLPEVLDEDVSSIPPFPAFDNDRTDSDSDADLFVSFTEKPITVCFCSCNTTDLKMCTRCFTVALCHRPRCKEAHLKYCEQI